MCLCLPASVLSLSGPCGGCHTQPDKGEERFQRFNYNQTTACLMAVFSELSSAMLRAQRVLLKSAQTAYFTTVCVCSVIALCGVRPLHEHCFFWASAWWGIKYIKDTALLHILL